MPIASSSRLFQPLLEVLPLRLPASELLLAGVVDPHSPLDILLLDEEEDDEEEEDEVEEALLPQGRGIPAGGPIIFGFPFPVWPALPGI